MGADRQATFRSMDGIVLYLSSSRTVTEENWSKSLKCIDHTDQFFSSSRNQLADGDTTLIKLRETPADDKFDAMMQKCISAIVVVLETVQALLHHQFN